MPNPLLALTNKRLTENDYQQAAKRLRTGVAEIKAVTEVESGGRGFDTTGRVIIRFEPHRFSFYTKGLYDVSHPLLSYPSWQPGYPTSLDHSWKLFKEAAALNPNAAVMATSWGLFQVLGQNFAACGCSNLGEFVQRMEKSEGEQLDMFCSLVLDWGLDDELRDHRWGDFARIFNGPLYKVNKYDVKLANSYKKWSKG